MNTFMIVDWANNIMFDDMEFVTEDDAFDFLIEHVTNEEDLEDIYVVTKEEAYEDKLYEDLI